MAFRVPFRWHVRSLCPNSNNINRFGQLGVHRRYQGFYRFGGGSQYERFNGSSYSRSAFWRWVQSPTFYYQVAGIGVLASGFYIINLETVPISGRRRFNIISIDMEQQLGDSIKQQTLSQYKGRILSHGERRHILVQRVLNKLIPASGLQENKWEIYVIDDPSQKNAFVIPGGKVFVFTGILPICGAGEDGVATVLSHEIAHTVARHSAEKMSQMFLIYGLGILALALGIDPGISHVLADLGYSRPGSRRQESEADFIGLMMMSESCYDPKKAIEFWQRMQKAERLEPPQFLSTHPSHQNRAGLIQQWLPEAESKLMASDCSATRGWLDDFRDRVPFQ